MRKPIFVIAFVFAVVLAKAQSYSPNAELRQDIQQTVLQELKPLTPEELKPTAELFLVSKELFSTYERTLRLYGLQPYDYYSPILFLHAIKKEIDDGKSLSRAESKTLITDVTAQLDANNVKASLPDDKQTYFDGMILKTFWLAYLHQSAPDNQLEHQELAQQLLTEFQLNFDGQAANKDVVHSPVPSPTPAPNTDNVEDVIMVTVTSYGLSGVYIENDVYVLYKNGVAWLNPSQPLHQLNVENERRGKPNKYYKWQILNNVLYLTNTKTGKTSDRKTWFSVRPAEAGTTLSGKYKTLDAWSGSVVLNASVISFEADGRFAQKTTKGGNTSWKPIYSSSSASGTYSLNGYTLTLQYNNGASEALFFGFYPKDDEHFIIGSSHYVP